MAALIAADALPRSFLPDDPAPARSALAQYAVADALAAELGHSVSAVSTAACAALRTLGRESPMVASSTCHGCESGCPPLGAEIWAHAAAGCAASRHGRHESTWRATSADSA